LLRVAELPTGDLTESQLRHFFVASSRDSTVGLVGLELYGRHALLRSLVVDPAARMEGIGSQLVEYAEAHARELGVGSIYLLTTTAVRFFVHRGYACVERGTTPECIHATREFASICPASCAFMIKHLQE
jgi:amino-acid N-acetyltransferase